MTREAGHHAGADVSVARGAREVGPALESHYRFVVWLVPVLERFPRTQKFLFGDRIHPAWPYSGCRTRSTTDHGATMARQVSRHGGECASGETTGRPG